MRFSRFQKFKKEETIRGNMVVFINNPKVYTTSDIGTSFSDKILASITVAPKNRKQQTAPAFVVTTNRNNS